MFFAVIAAGLIERLAIIPPVYVLPAIANSTNIKALTLLQMRIIRLFRPIS